MAEGDKRRSPWVLRAVAAGVIGTALGFGGFMATASADNTPQAPSITSVNNAQLTVGSPFSFSVTTTGFPTPALTETGALPPGITFTDNGDGTAAIAGTSAAGSGGTYAISITADNGDGTPATQLLTLTNDEAPAVTSSANAQAAVRSPFSFTVTTTGFPTPALTETGALPPGITFTDNSNGTATIAGTSAPGSGGTYSISITADNGDGTPAIQPFTLANDDISVFTSAATSYAAVGSPFSFNVTTTGFPAPALTETGALPPGITFTDNSNGTATIAGTSAPGSGGTYSISITANNGVGTVVTQAFILVNFESAVITSAASAQAAVGSPFSFTVTTRGYPRPVLSETGTLPPGITFIDNGNGTATIAGTASAGAGPYSLTITASNWITTVTQPFALGNDLSPQITSRDYVEAPAGPILWGPIVVVTTTGYPTPTITETGALPPGTTFKDKGNGTATLTGAPPVGSDGQYPLTITASNGVGSPAIQPFRLLVGYIPPSCCAKVADVGDSITLDATNAIETALSPSYFLQINGYPGAWMAYQFPTIEAFQNDPTGAPSDWIIELGTNDMVLKNPNWSSALQNEVNYLSNAHCVVLLTISPRLKSFDRATSALNKSIKAVPLSHKNMHVLDWGTIEYQNPSWLLPDQIHPSPAGATELASLELKALKKNC